MPREKTMDEVRKEFFERVVARCVDVVFNENKSKKDAVEAAIFAVLTTLEGSGDFPFCAVVPQPHPDDKQFWEGEGEDWYPRPELAPDMPLEDMLLRGEDHHEFVELFRRRLEL